ncbi:zinc finger protein 770 [Platichthys flesus]|uniref:zinc finger protein 770 n=1 Tax=Platichthys flesus TaxID=8260 RepID=UPI002DB59CC0|nr:zinc finger protein 770 [Platichthys flesus]
MHRCPDCPKTFPSPSKLKRHHLIHTGHKPFSCGSCGKAFNQSHHLKLHLQNVHRSQAPAGTPPEVTSTNPQRPSCDKPAAGTSTRVGGNWAEIPSTVSSSVASKPQWRSTTVGLPLSETGNQFKPKSHVTEVTAPVSRDVDLVHQEQVHLANVNPPACEGLKRHTCKVCSKSFNTSLQLWIHLPTHNKSKPPPGRGQSIFKKGPWKMNFQSQESRSASKRIMSLRHQCPKCLKGFCSPSKLKRHFLIHTDQKPYSCSSCWKSFRQKGHLKTHLGTENKCPLSAANARLRLSNDSRTSRLQPETQLHCPSSNQDSSVELKLQCEIRVNTLHELNTTEIKLNSFVKPEQTLNPSFQCHESGGVSQHLTQKRFRCLICNRSFRLEVNLIRHGRFHWNPKESGSPTSVPNCHNVKMSNSDAIKRVPEPEPADLTDFNIIVKPEMHRENLRDSLPLEAASVPSAEQPRETFQQRRINPSHQCRSCAKGFPSPSKLKRHMMIHTGQRPFSCETCGKRFRQKTHLRVHCRTHLLTRYQKQRSLYINRPPSRIGGFHTRTAADVPVQEVIGHKKCNETVTGCDGISAKQAVQTPSTGTVQNNVKTESGIQLFPQTSKKREVLSVMTAPRVNNTQTAKPVQSNGNTRHQCTQCLKCFPSPSKLKRHEMVHTGLKPFRCPTCGKAFRQRTHLKTHEGGHCTRRPSQPVNQQASIKKLKMNPQQQQLYPRITVCVPSLQHSVNTNTHSVSRDATSRDQSVQHCTRPELPNAKVNGPFEANTKSTTCKKKKLHTCRICCKNFSSPYKLSRHLLTHSGVRPYKCSFCSKTLTQHGHLKLHERRCRHRSRSSDWSHREMVSTNHLQEKPVENIIYCTDFDLDAVTEQRECSYSPTSVSSFTAGDLAYCPEAVDTDWLAAPDSGLQEENYTSGETVDQAADSSNQASDQFSYSFPSELAFEISKLIQSQGTAAPPLSHQPEDNKNDVETPRQREGGTADSLKNKVLGDVSSVNQLRTDSRSGDWCEPVIVFECGECTTHFMSDAHLKQHLCPARVQPEGTKETARNRCDVCFKHFVSPSKLVRHSLVHTGQRPFTCDVCGKTFTQRSHVTTHRQTH